jgi:putative FmdB family regulatory protein
MPLYEYQCRSCRHEFEALVRGSDVPACPACKSQDLERLLSSFGMSTLEHTKEVVKKERKRRLPAHQNEQREEFQKTMREHLDHEG